VRMKAYLNFIAHDIPRTQNIPDFVVSDPQSPDGSEDFEVASIAGTSNPKPSTPDSASMFPKLVICSQVLILY
jgi:hypothetical protein